MSNSLQQHKRDKRAHGRARRQQAGFTIVELMAALTAGLIAIGGLYAFTQNSTRYFQQQTSVMETQQAVRVAFERLRRDVARAGFGGTPFDLLERGGGHPSLRVQAVEVCDGEGAGRIPNEANNGVHADRLLLTGNYETGDTYLAESLGPAGNTITFQRCWPAFQRSFGSPPPIGTPPGAPSVGICECDEIRFNRVFQQDRLVHVKTREGFHFFSRISGASACTVQLGESIPVGTSRAGGIGEGAVVSPLSRIEYTVLSGAELTSAGLTHLVPTHASADALGDIPAVLVRREVNFSENHCAPSTVRPDSTEVILEYVANFDLAAMVDVAVPPALPILNFERGVRVQDRSAGSASNLGPHQFRSLVLELAARTPRSDRNFPWIARIADAPLMRFQIRADDTHAARVRSIHSEITLLNLFPGTRQ